MLLETKFPSSKFDLNLLGILRCSRVILRLCKLILIFDKLVDFTKF
jgi:hypothetical protein